MLLILAANSSAPSKTSWEETVPGRRPLVLCIDSDLGRSKRKKLLMRHGYDVLTAANEHEGFSVLREYPVDAIILGIDARETGHGAVVRRMKDFKPHIPVLLLSASGKIPRSAADAVVLNDDAPTRLAGILDHLLNVRFPFFTRWFGNWKHRDSVQ